MNEEFGAKPEEITWAHRVIAIYERAKSEGRASIQLDGKMIDIPIVVRAERILAEAKRVEQRAART